MTKYYNVKAGVKLGLALFKFKSIMILFTHGFEDNTLSPLAIELSIVNLLPGPKVEFTSSDLGR